LGNLAGGADQVLEVAQRNGPAESADGGRSILAGLFDRLWIGPSCSVRGISDGLQADGQIQQGAQRTRRNSAIQTRAVSIIRHHVATAGRQARARASITETDRHGPVIGNPRRVDSVRRASAEEAGHFGPPNIVDHHLQRRLRSARFGAGYVGERMFLQCELLESNCSVAISQNSSVTFSPWLASATLPSKSAE